MVTRDLSGCEVAKVPVKKGNFRWVWTPGDHVILKWEHPDVPEGDARTVSIPLHDRVRIGTLRSIADDAGANDFDEFCKWIDRNR